MTQMIHLSAKDPNAVPELFSSIADRRSGQPEVMEAAQHYRRAELSALEGDSSLDGFLESIQSDSGMQMRVLHALDALRMDVVKACRDLASQGREASPKMHEMHHEVLMATQCFVIHMSEAIARTGSADPEDAGRFARCRLGMTISPEDFYQSMNLIAPQAEPDVEDGVSLQV